nr:hypothetical protein [Tanacetum cinerariifolium]
MDAKVQNRSKSGETVEIGRNQWKSVEIDRNRSKSVENGVNRWKRSKSIENGRKRWKTVENGRNRSKTAKIVKIGGNGQNRPKTVKIGGNWSKTVKNDGNRSIMIEIGRKRSKSVKNDRKRSKIVEIDRKRLKSVESEQIDVYNLDEATRVNIATCRSIEDYEAQQVVKKVDEHLLDEDIEKIVDRDKESDANKFADDMINNQEDLCTRTYLASHKESPEVEKVVDYMSIDEEVKEESTEDALIRKKGKGKLEIRDTPLTSTPRYPRTNTDSLSSDKKNYRNWRLPNQHLHHPNPRLIVPSISRATVEETLKVVVPKMVNETIDQNMKDNLHMVMKDDEQARNVDLPICLALIYKFEKPATHVDPCRVGVFCRADHEDHHDEDTCPEGESSAKRQRTSEKSTYTRDYQGTNDDEVPSKEVSPELLTEISRNNANWVPTTKDQNYMQEALNVMMRNRCGSREEHQYRLDHMKRVHDYQLGLESYQVKNIKKQKRIMDIDEIPKLFDAILKRVSKEVKKINLDVKHGYANLHLSYQDAQFMRFYEEYIQERLRHQYQMRRWESFVNERPLGQR